MDGNSRSDGDSTSSPSGFKKRVVDILSSFIKGRPSPEVLREKNIFAKSTVSPRIHGYDDTTVGNGGTLGGGSGLSNKMNGGRSMGDAKTYGGSSSGSGSSSGLKSAWERIRNLDFTFSKFQFGKTVVHRLNFPQFGLSPTELQSLYPEQPDGIPLVLTKCFEFLKKGYLDTEGLFRVPGSKRDISLLKFRVEDGDLNFDDVLNPYSICGLISTFLKEMPEPLIPLDQYQYAINCVQQETEEKKINSLKTLIADLPPANLCLMKKFLEFVLLIEEKKDVNKMNSDNLGIIFGPTLMKDPDFEDISKSFVNLKHQSQVVKFLIDYFHKIFQSKQVSLSMSRASTISIPMDTSSIDYLDPALEDSPKRMSNVGQYSTVAASSFSGLPGKPKPLPPPRPTRNSHRRETIMLSPRVSGGVDNRMSQVYAITTLTRPQSKIFNPEILSSPTFAPYTDGSKPPPPRPPIRKINTINTNISNNNNNSNTTTATTPPVIRSNTTVGVVSKPPPQSAKPPLSSKPLPALKPSATVPVSTTPPTTTPISTTTTTPPPPITTIPQPVLKPVVKKAAAVLKPVNSIPPFKQTVPPVYPPLPGKIEAKPLPGKVTNITKAPPTVTNAALLQAAANGTSPSTIKPTTAKVKPEPPKRSFTNTSIDSETGDVKVDSPSLKPMPVKHNLLKQVPPPPPLISTTSQPTEKAPDSPVVQRKKAPIDSGNNVPPPTTTTTAVTKKVTINEGNNAVVPSPTITPAAATKKVTINESNNATVPIPTQTTTTTTTTTTTPTPSTNNAIITKPYPSKSSPPMLTAKTNSFSSIKEIHEKLQNTNINSGAVTLPVSSTTSNNNNSTTNPPGKSRSFITLKPSATTASTGASQSTPTTPTTLTPSSTPPSTPIPSTTTKEEPTSTNPLLNNRKYLNPNNKSKSASALNIGSTSSDQPKTVENSTTTSTSNTPTSISTSTTPTSNITTSILKKSAISNSNPPLRVVQFQSPDVQKK
ncbi:RhoGAP domain-containing protein [Tieghemostelium lacteum]|uniref:RhoGAP domain-containing protein n=1 Tax=Tieghemostelium lacteum TaxID=361077 RepID=A0A152A9C0_TIELA|nr:RhoGAP domain-containing protein [Tieghemostelium lacteum]|eukprot:KYR02725.1 RhoGAP domain-containing protein [Tieghemostelium lacteum]